MAVTAQSCPDFRIVSEFRKRHLKAVSGLFVQVLAPCRKAGLATLGHVALDGTSIKANALQGGHELRADEDGGGEPGGRGGAMDGAGRCRGSSRGSSARSDEPGDELPDWVATKEPQTWLYNRHY
jgi:hypothetical protein